MEAIFITNRINKLGMSSIFDFIKSVEKEKKKQIPRCRFLILYLEIL